MYCAPATFTCTSLLAAEHYHFAISSFQIIPLRLRNSNSKPPIGGGGGRNPSSTSFRLLLVLMVSVPIKDQNRSSLLISFQRDGLKRPPNPGETLPPFLPAHSISQLTSLHGLWGWTTRMISPVGISSTCSAIPLCGEPACRPQKLPSGPLALAAPLSVSRWDGQLVLLQLQPQGMWLVQLLRTQLEQSRSDWEVPWPEGWGRKGRG